MRPLDLVTAKRQIDDFVDRERVRDILLDKFNYDHKNGTW
jgi:hypothetical protein